MARTPQQIAAQMMGNQAASFSTEIMRLTQIQDQLLDEIAKLKEQNTKLTAQLDASNAPKNEKPNRPNGKAVENGSDKSAPVGTH